MMSKSSESKMLEITLFRKNMEQIYIFFRKNTIQYNVIALLHYRLINRVFQIIIPNAIPITYIRISCSRVGFVQQRFHCMSCGHNENLIVTCWRFIYYISISKNAVFMSQ